MPKIELTRNGQTKQYEVPDKLTFREMGLIKKLSGVRGAEFNDALNAGDPEVVAAMTLIAVRRSGETMSEDEIFDMEIESLALKGDDEDETEAEADPTVAVEVEPEADTAPEASAE